MRDPALVVRVSMCRRSPPLVASCIVVRPWCDLGADSVEHHLRGCSRRRGRWRPRLPPLLGLSASYPNAFASPFWTSSNVIAGVVWTVAFSPLKNRSATHGNSDWSSISRNQ